MNSWRSLSVKQEEMLLYIVRNCFHFFINFSEYLRQQDSVWGIKLYTSDVIMSWDLLVWSGMTLVPLPQKTSSVATPQIIWERPGSAAGQAGRAGLCFGRWLGLRLGLQQTQQHAVPPRGAAETAEGRGGRNRPETSKDPRQIKGSPLLARSPVCLPVRPCEPEEQRFSPAFSGHMKMLYGSCIKAIV